MDLPTGYEKSDGHPSSCSWALLACKAVRKPGTISSQSVSKNATDVGVASSSCFGSVFASGGWGHPSIYVVAVHTDDL